jgi:hypothetical protein
MSHKRKKFVTCTPSRRGYVLVMAIALIALAGLALVGIARQSLTVAFRAVSAEEELQRRWGALSCRRALLNRAPEIIEFEIDARSTDGGERRFDASQLTGSWRLGGMSFRWTLADENAKVNVNTVFALRGIQGASELVRDFARSDAKGAPEVFLRPHRTGAMDAESTPFESWGQVFDLDRVRKGVSAPQEIAGATARITCWGGGLLNVERASDAALDRLCGLVVGNDVIRRLQVLRRQRANLEISDVLNELGLNETERNALQPLLTDNSDYYSLWIEVATKARSWHEFHVASSAATADEGSTGPDGLPTASENADTSASFQW